MTINSKQKGKRGELELAAWLKDHGFTARRGQQFKGTPDSPDVVVAEWPWAHIECKRVQKLNLRAAMEQAQNDAGNKIPLVIHRTNDKPWLVTLSLADFIELVSGHDSFDFAE